MLWPHTKTPDESLGLHYVLLVLAQDKFLQLDTTSFLQKPNMSYQLKCKDLHFAAKGHYYNLLPGLITPPYIEELQRPQQLRETESTDTRPREHKSNQFYLYQINRLAVKQNLGRYCACPFSNIVKKRGTYLFLLLHLPATTHSPLTI